MICFKARSDSAVPNVSPWRILLRRTCCLHIDCRHMLLCPSDFDARVDDTAGAELAHVMLIRYLCIKSSILVA